MKRAPMIVAAFLMLLFAFTPQPPAGHTTAPPPEQTRPTVEEVTRHTRTETAHSSVVVRAGDTYGRWAVAHCGTFNAWHNIQAVNRWPERRIPVGATAIIVCGVAAASPATPPTKPIVIGSAWVHPLSSGKQGNSCYRSAKRPGHNGVDIAQPWGTPIRAASAGTITRKAYQPGGAGYHVTVAHADGVYTRYHHLRAHSPMPLGANVKAGQTIGYVGRTGNATGNHLHFEVMRGGTANRHHLNPAPFMRQRGVNIGC